MGPALSSMQLGQQGGVNYLMMCSMRIRVMTNNDKWMEIDAALTRCFHPLLLN